jgi:hypothetical protein
MPPDNSFRKAEGDMYCEAPHGGQGCHNHNARLTISLEPGYTIDRSYQQAALRCCGGDEYRGDGRATEIPAGVYMEFSGGNDGEWGVFGLRLVADADKVDEEGRVTAWTVTADDVYCGPSAAIGKGGCNVHATAWIKVKRIK